MAWSIFATGGNAAAASWAHDFVALNALPGVVAQVVYEWETSEGGGGRWNPLNCGPLTEQECKDWHLPFIVASLTGEQYGGGAADYADRDSGLRACSDYLHMSNYANVLGAARRGDLQGMRQAIWDSPWAASHYGHGTAWSHNTIPSTATQQNPWKPHRLIRLLGDPGPPVFLLSLDSKGLYRMHVPNQSTLAQTVAYLKANAYSTEIVEVPHAQKAKVAAIRQEPWNPPE